MFLEEDYGCFKKESYDESHTSYYPFQEFEAFQFPPLKKQPSVSQFLTGNNNMSKETESNQDPANESIIHPNWVDNPLSVNRFGFNHNCDSFEDFDITTKLIKNISQVEQAPIWQIQISPLHLTDSAGESIHDSTESAHNSNESADDSIESSDDSREPIKSLPEPDNVNHEGTSHLTNEMPAHKACVDEKIAMRPTSNLGLSSKKIQKKAVKQSKFTKPQKHITASTNGRKPKSTKTKKNLKNAKTVSKLPLDGCNNIVKNYGKAMAAFAVSEAAIPYLQPFITSNRILYEEFADFVYSQKESIDCIGSLRNVLLIDETDSQETAVYKKIFKEICMVFLKYFSVNWIYNGKMTRKRDHLNCRFHLMRRVANPSQFTYLK